MKMGSRQLRDTLAQRGYCVIPNIIDSDMLQSLKERFSQDALAPMAKGNFGDAGAFVVADYHDPVIVNLLTWPKTMETLSALGFSAPKLHNFYVSTKPPQAAGLAWHSDLFYEYDMAEPAELFLIYYLQDTTPENGCLRVVPSSHLWPHKQRHQQPHDAALRSDEIDVPIKTGELFIGDRRLLHATHANQADTWRTCLTIAYAPRFDTLAEPIKALIVRNRCLPPAGWHKQAQHDLDPRLTPVLPIYEGTAQPIATV
ncbi:MAG TPA: phytanoyl-CoA dioxygenase family protein [Verrucomicrobiae bacterium]|nr:phytanoyl-CoA dioxygenase family protein [Verrucomicrobiae bacterium]